MSKLIHASESFVEKVRSKVDILVGSDTNKSVRTIAAEEVAKIAADAPEAYDTLKEIADYIASDKKGAANLANRVSGLESGKVDKVEGKSLSTNDYTGEDKMKLTGIEAGANKTPALASVATSGSYNDLDNKPKINGVELAENKTAMDLKLAMADDVAKKRDKTDNIVAADSFQFSDWKFTCDVPEIQAALDANPPTVTFHSLEYDESYWILNHGDVGGWMAAGDWGDTSDHDTVSIVFDHAYVKEDSDEYADVTATREKVSIAVAGESYVSLTGVATLTANKIPKYEFVDAAIVDGVLTVAPYTNAQFTSNGTAFTVAIGSNNDGNVRDCALMVDCTSLETAPKITWPANFHPRTDAETDFACVAGECNVYWISEYAEGEFVVAGWQETEGGNAA